MKSKSWVLVFLLILAVGIGGYMGINYYADPLGYFSNEKGLDHCFSDDYTRAIKAKYILAHKDEIEAIVMGGSKTGTLETDLFTQYSGLHYYNMYMNIGNFSDYLDFTKLFLEKTNIKELTLSLSSFETRGYDWSNKGTNYKKSAVVVGNKFEQIQEFLTNLMVDQATVREAFTKRMKKNPLSGDPLDRGMRNRRTATLRYLKDPEDNLQKMVLKTYQKDLEELFAEEVEETQEEYRTLNLEALREIKRLCDEKGVTLKVFFGASFLGERNDYECHSYYAYMAEVVNIVGEVWDFSDYNDVNLNPYNFYDRKHYHRGVGELTIKTMYGVDSMEGFGQILTPENIYEYLEKREADFQKYKKEYEETGTVALYEQDGPGFVEWTVDPTWQIGDLSSEVIEDESEAEA